jgi:tRNA acetyltransferase TAN1
MESNINPKNSESKKRKKSCYSKNKSNKKFNSNRNVLSEGMTGFMVTCNAKEYQCLRETYSLLNEFSDKLYDKSNKTNESLDIDIETEIQNELNSLKTSEKRFQQVITKCNNVLFIKSNDKAIDPLIISSEILKEIETNGKQLTQHLLRMIPIVITCKPLGTNFEQLIESNLSKQTNDVISYVIQCKVRNNSQIKKLQLIESVVNIVKRVRPQWSVSFDKPKLTISLEVLQKTCCIAFLIDYNYYCKYNLVEFSKKVINNKNKNEVNV